MAQSKRKIDIRKGTAMFFTICMIYVNEEVYKI